jgi:hypothetical protein
MSITIIAKKLSSKTRGQLQENEWKNIYMKWTQEYKFKNKVVKCKLQDEKQQATRWRRYTTLSTMSNDDWGWVGLEIYSLV